MKMKKLLVMLVSAYADQKVDPVVPAIAVAPQAIQEDKKPAITNVAKPVAVPAPKAVAVPAPKAVAVPAPKAKKTADAKAKKDAKPAVVAKPVEAVIYSDAAEAVYVKKYYDALRKEHGEPMNVKVTEGGVLTHKKEYETSVDVAAHVFNSNYYWLQDGWLYKACIYTISVLTACTLIVALCQQRNHTNKMNAAGVGMTIGMAIYIIGPRVGRIFSKWYNGRNIKYYSKIAMYGKANASALAYAEYNEYKLGMNNDWFMKTGLGIIAGLSILSLLSLSKHMRR